MNPEAPLLFFSAETTGTKHSLIGRYYELTSYFTPLVLLLTFIPAVVLWGKVSTIWLLLVALLIPLHFWLIHLLVVRMLYQKSLSDDRVPRIYITNQFISIEGQNHNNQFFTYTEICDLTIIIGGLEKPKWYFWFPDNTPFNEISFKYQQKMLRIPFRIFSAAQLSQLDNALTFWENHKIPFREYNEFSGVPLKR